MNIADYNKCVDQYADFVYRFLMKSLRNEAVVKDLVQDSFEKLWRAHEELDAQKAKPYLFRCAYNAMIDYIRQDRRTSDLEQSANIPQHSFNQYTGIQEILQQAMQLMKPEQRSVILLRDLQGYQYQEIADITGLSLAQVKVYIFRGRVFLKQYLEKAGIHSHSDLEELV
ncbi:MAG: RNA polymerase sigma factor [Bacteroidales bacterium]|nr:RNA polymerase sigma factor [Bacteroidales bacterium]